MIVILEELTWDVLSSSFGCCERVKNASGSLLEQCAYLCIVCTCARVDLYIRTHAPRYTRVYMCACNPTHSSTSPRHCKKSIDSCYCFR